MRTSPADSGSAQKSDYCRGGIRADTPLLQKYGLYRAAHGRAAAAVAPVLPPDASNAELAIILRGVTRAARALTAIAVLLAGCGLIGIPGPMPDYVANREVLPACGSEQSQHGEALNVGARQCLLEAFSEGRAAEFITTQMTVEGDPVMRIIRVLADGRVQIFADATRDRFGSGQWEEIRCTRLLPVSEYNDPPDEVMSLDTVFVEDGCQRLDA